MQKCKYLDDLGLKIGEKETIEEYKNCKRIMYKAVIGCWLKKGFINENISCWV